MYSPTLIALKLVVLDCVLFTRRSSPIGRLFSSAGVVVFILFVVFSSFAAAKIGLSNYEASLSLSLRILQRPSLDGFEPLSASVNDVFVEQFAR